MASLRRRTLLSLFFAWCIVFQVTATQKNNNNNSPPSQQHLRKALRQQPSQEEGGIEIQRSNRLGELSRRRVKEEEETEALEVVHADKETVNEQQQDESKIVKDGEGASIEENKEKPSSSSSADGSSLSGGASGGNEVEQMPPAAKPANVHEAEDPLLAQEDSTSTILLDISLSLTAQRVLGSLAAILAMIWTAHQMSENPDGIYAGLCRSIITGFRVVCRIVTCKACWDGMGFGGAHRHVPVSMDAY